MSDQQKKEHVKNAVTDLVHKLLWDDRKEDEALPRGVIEDLMERKKLSEADIVTWFRNHLHEELSERGLV